MNFFIKKIFDGKVDESVHLQFQKFSRGEFKDKAMIKAKNSKGKYTIYTTYEYANELVRACGELLGSDKTKVTGVIVTADDLTGKLDFKEKKQFMGVKRYIMDNEISGDEIVSLCDKLPLAFFGLSFKVGDTELKIKAKSPKSAKPSSKGGPKPKINFCKLKTTNKSLVNGLIFNDLDFKEVGIVHVFVIEDIIVDSSIQDPKEMREKAKRKGKIIRKLVIDEKEKTVEKIFEA